MYDSPYCIDLLTTQNLNDRLREGNFKYLETELQSNQLETKRDRCSYIYLREIIHNDKQVLVDNQWCNEPRKHVEQLMNKRIQDALKDTNIKKIYIKSQLTIILTRVPCEENKKRSYGYDCKKLLVALCEHFQRINLFVTKIDTGNEHGDSYLRWYKAMQKRVMTELNAAFEVKGGTATVLVEDMDVNKTYFQENEFLTELGRMTYSVNEEVVESGNDETKDITVLTKQVA